MRTTRRAILFAAAALALGAPSAGALGAGDTLRIVVPYSPGGGFDAQARLIAPYVETALRNQGLQGVTVIVENLTGGGGAIATATVHAARPDGRTVLFLDPESSIWQQTIGSAPFKVEEFSYIAQMSVDPMVFMVRSDLGLDTFDAVVARSQRQPILIGTAGKGGHDHIMPVIFQKLLNDAGVGIRFDYLHFDGTAPILASMRRREVEGALEVTSVFGPAEQAGELRFLFDFSEALPWTDAVDVLPLTAEQLAPFAAATNFRRVFVAPPGMAEATLETLRAAFASALADAELRQAAAASNRPVVFLDGPAIAEVVRLQAELAATFSSYLQGALD